MICDKTTAEASSAIRDRKLSEVSIVKRDWMEIRFDDGSGYAIPLKKIQGYPVKRIMKPYTDDCKPPAPGWYWVAYSRGTVRPSYYGGIIWYRCGTPLFWLEMEPPEKPEGEA